MIFVGQKAPDFTCDAVVDGQLKKVSLHDFDKQYKLIFFYPLNFTFVCPTELHALQAHLADFKERNTQVLAVSVDSQYSHLSWLTTPKSNGGIEGVSFPLLSDLTKTIARDYGVLNEAAGVALRGVFLLDKDNVVQHATINNLALGRNISEFVRLVDALHHVETVGEVCPADWQAGKKGMTATPAGVRSYFSSPQ
jgi:peroxiredoxin (alkyl hydroperoxide reductase subunit C)